MRKILTNQIDIIAAIARQKVAIKSIRPLFKINRTDIEMLCAAYAICDKNSYFFDAVEARAMAGKGSEAAYLSINKLLRLGLIERLTQTRSPIEPHRYSVASSGRRILGKYLEAMKVDQPDEWAVSVLQ